MRYGYFTVILTVTLFLPVLLQVNPVYGQVDLTDFAALKKPVGVVWTSGGFIASHQDDGETKLVRISLDGKTVEPFAPSFKGEGEVYIALSHGKAGFPEGYLYVSSGNSIYEIDPSGSRVRFFAKPFEAMGLGYIAFDTVGTWEYLLYAVNFNGLLWSVDAAGNVKQVVNLGNDLLPESITVAPEDFGDFGGDLVISLEMGRKVIALSKKDPGKATVLIEFKGESPERVLPIPSGSNLYLAKYEANTIVKISADQFTPHVGGLVVITEGEAGEPGSITVLKAKGNTITITKIYEDPKSPHFEGAVFLPVTSAQTVTTVMTVQATQQSDLLIVGVAGVAVVISVSIFIWARRSKKP